MSPPLAQAYIDGQSKQIMSEAGGEPRLGKVEGPVPSRPDGGRGLAIPICAPTALLGTGGEPCPNSSKVEGPILFRSEGEKGPATPICTPTAALETRGGPRPN